MNSHQFNGNEHDRLLSLWDQRFWDRHGHDSDVAAFYRLVNPPVSAIRDCCDVEIIASKITYFMYVGDRPLCVSGEPRSGEHEGRSIVTTANTHVIFVRCNDGSTASFCPSSPANKFAPHHAIEPGSFVAIQGKQDFTFPCAMPYSDRHPRFQTGNLQTSQAK